MDKPGDSIDKLWTKRKGKLRTLPNHVKLNEGVEPVNRVRIGW